MIGISTFGKFFRWGENGRDKAELWQSPPNAHVAHFKAGLARLGGCSWVGAGSESTINSALTIRKCHVKLVVFYFKYHIMSLLKKSKQLSMMLMWTSAHRQVASCRCSTAAESHWNLPFETKTVHWNFYTLHLCAQSVPNCHTLVCAPKELINILLFYSNKVIY